MMTGNDVIKILKDISSKFEIEGYRWQDEPLFNHGAQFAGFVVKQLETLPPLSQESDMYYLVYDRLGYMSIGLFNNWVDILTIYGDVLFALDPYLTIGKEYEASELEKIEIIIHASIAIVGLYKGGHYQDAELRVFRDEKES